jgi:hypothetical protein
MWSHQTETFEVVDQVRHLNGLDHVRIAALDHLQDRFSVTEGGDHDDACTFPMGNAKLRFKLSDLLQHRLTTLFGEHDIKANQIVPLSRFESSPEHVYSPNAVVRVVRGAKRTQESLKDHPACKIVIYDQ